MSEHDPQDISGMVNNAFPDQIITHWIVIAETVGSETHNLQIATSDGMTSWLANGMLTCAGDIILNAQYDSDLED